MIFADRTIAGKQLAETLQLHLKTTGHLNAAELLVIGLPRGGVPVALEVARKLACPMDILVSKKISFPGQPEYAIGAVTSDGIVMLNEDIVKRCELDSYIETERQRLLLQTQEIENEFRTLANCPHIDVDNKIVVLVDDGIATGMTAIAAVGSIQHRGAKRIIVAAPVMSIESYHDLDKYCDDVIAISLPQEFLAVGCHYDKFTQTTNEEVVKALHEATGMISSLKAQ